MKRIILHQILFFLSFTSLSVSSYGQDQEVMSTTRSSPRGIISFAETVQSSVMAPGKYVDGYVKKYGTVSFIFPVGDNGVYRPFSAAADGTTGAYFMVNPSSATDPPGAPFSVANMEDALTKISAREFWDIDGANTTKLTLTWNAASDIAGLTGDKLDKLIIAGWNPGSAKWEKLISTVDPTSLTGGTSSLTAGSITTNAALAPDTYSVYTLASLPANPLPVTLISFKATVSEAEIVLLNWKTSTEINSDQFNVERSGDAKTWQMIGSVKARGESSASVNYDFRDVKPLSDQNFYRLKMLDSDGTFAYSKIEHVNAVGQELLVIYPNPVSDRLFVDNNNSGRVKKITLYNMSGQKVYQAGSVSTLGVNLGNVASGKYLVNLVLENGTTQQHNIVVNK